MYFLSEIHSDEQSSKFKVDEYTCKFTDGTFNSVKILNPLNLLYSEYNRYVHIQLFFEAVYSVVSLNNYIFHHVHIA